jgi:hypothetical protein
MTLVDALTATGALTWAWLAWQGFQFMRGLPARLAWAIWGQRSQQRTWRHG